MALKILKMEENLRVDSKTSIFLRILNSIVEGYQIPCRIQVAILFSLELSFHSIMFLPLKYPVSEKVFDFSSRVIIPPLTLKRWIEGSIWLSILEDNLKSLFVRL